MIKPAYLQGPVHYMVWGPLNGSVIVMFQSMNSHNLCKMHAQSHFSKRKSHLKSPDFFGDSIRLAAPTFLCREALQLVLCSFQTGLRQPGLPQDHKRCWRTVTQFLKFPASDSHISISYLYGLVLRWHLANRSAWPGIKIFFQLSVVNPMNRRPRKRFLNMTMVEKVFSNYQQGSWTCRDHFDIW